MRRILGPLICWGLLVPVSAKVWAVKPATVHPGYKRHMASTYLIYEGVLQDYFDEGRNFFIQIEGQAGLYRFPKSADNSAEVRKFLDEKRRLKKKIKIEVNAQTAEITNLSDGT